MVTNIEFTQRIHKMVGVVFLTLWAFLFSSFANAQAPGSFVVDEIVFEGNNRVDAEALHAQLPQRSGEFTQGVISETVKTLYNTGFFEQVQARLVVYEGVPARRVLKFVVTEKPIVRRVFIRGNEGIAEGDLKDIVTFGGQRFLDKVKIQSIIKNAENFYKSRGFYDAKFDYSLEQLDDNRVDVTFTVNEGVKFRIANVQFEGLREVNERDLRKILQTSRYKWWSSWIFGTGRVDPEKIENDKQLIRQYFMDNGYIDGTVGEVAVEKKNGRLVVSFAVSEGDKFKIGELGVRGDLIDQSQGATLNNVELKSGDTFSASALRKAAFDISDKFGDLGHAFANVTPDTRIRRSEREVDVLFSVDKGPLVTVDNILIQGNQKTLDNVIRREIRIAEQELYSRSKIRRSQELLERLGYFEEVNITSEPGPDSSTVDLLVDVREGSTGTFSIGAGYSTSDGAIFNTRLAENNIFGTGRSLNLNLDVGSERNNIILSYDDRRFNDSHLSFGADVMRTEREFSDFDRRLQGGGVTLGYALEELFGLGWAQDMHVSTKYEYLDILIDEVDEDNAAQLVIDSEGTSTASAITPRIVRNTINNPLNPSQGSRQTLSVELAGLGGSEEYYLLEGRNQWYTPVFQIPSGADVVFSWRVHAAYGDSYDDEPFPLFRRFFPGGINSVRGYKSRTLGPKDARGNEYGGSKELVNNLEVIFPLLSEAGFKGVVFYDLGEAFDDDQSIDFGELRKAWGFGLRWMSPLGPLRLEFGYPIDREPGEDSMVTSFSFGAPF